MAASVNHGNIKDFETDLRRKHINQFGKNLDMPRINSVFKINIPW